MPFAIITSALDRLDELAGRLERPWAVRAAPLLVTNAHLLGLLAVSLALFGAIGLLVFAGLFAGVRALPRRARFWALAPYFCGAWLAAAVMIGLSGLLFGWSWLGLPACSLWLAWARRNRSRHVAGLVGTWLAIGWCVFHSELAVLMAAWCVLGAFFLAGGLFTSGLPRQGWPFHHSLLSVTLCLSALPIWTFYNGYEAHSYARIAAQDGVQGLFQLGWRDEAGRQLRSAWWPGITRRLTFVTETCDPSLLYVGTQMLGRGLSSFDAETHVLTQGSLPFEASENAVLDCARDEFTVGDCNHEHVYVLADGDVDRLLRRVTTAVDRMVWLGRDLSTGELYASGQDGRVTAVGDGTTDVAAPLASGNGKFFVVDRGKVLRGAKFPLAYDEKRGRILESTFDGGCVEARAREGGALLASGFTERGVRYIAYCARYDVVLALGYTRGYLYLLEPEKLRPLKRLYVGRKGKWISLSQDQQYAYVNSAAGAFKIDIGRLLEAAPAGSRPPVGVGS